MIDYKDIFINKYKKDCIESGKQNHILPSFIMMTAIMSSDFGEKTECVLSRNLFLTPVQNNYDKCYSLDSQKIYDRADDAREKEPGTILIKTYDTYNESIYDFSNTLINTRRSKDGPYKYHNIMDCNDYKEFIDKIVRDGFIEEYYHMNPDINMICEMINIIEKYKLYEFDKEDESVSKKSRKTYKKTVSKVQETEEVCTDKKELMENYTKMYRVMLDWEKIETKIFASPILKDAIEEASKHEGYKVYDDDGNLIKDPWKKEELVENDNIKTLVIPQGGERVILNKTPVYRSANSKVPFKYFTGDEFYYYDDTITNNRAKITKHKAAFLIKNPILILGYIELGE